MWFDERRPRKVTTVSPKQLSASHRRVLMTTCQAHGAAGFTNLLLTKEDGLIVLNLHVANCCVLRLDEQAARALYGILEDWLG
jgi:hypothetical protein